MGLVDCEVNNIFVIRLPFDLCCRSHCLKAVQLVMKISRKNLNRKILWKIFQKIFPFFIRTVDMVSVFTFYTVIIMLIYTSPFILIGR
jgi:Na+-driven multidrug efflux pump